MSTKSSTRIKLVALAAAITGSLVFVSEVQAQPDPTPVPAVLESLERQTAELNAGEPSVFVPIPSFRTYDTREFGEKMKAAWLRSLLQVKSTMGELSGFLLMRQL